MHLNHVVVMWLVAMTMAAFAVASIESKQVKPSDDQLLEHQKSRRAEKDAEQAHEDEERGFEWASRAFGGLSSRFNKFIQSFRRRKPAAASVVEDLTKTSKPNQLSRQNAFKNSKFNVPDSEVGNLGGGVRKMDSGGAHALDRVDEVATVHGSISKGQKGPPSATIKSAGQKLTNLLPLTRHSPKAQPAGASLAKVPSSKTGPEGAMIITPAKSNTKLTNVDEDDVFHDALDTFEAVAPKAKSMAKVKSDVVP